jgi:drug/metabolite transporter (DMT)-like permease
VELALCIVSAAGFGSLAIFGKQAYAGGLGVVGVLAVRFAVAAPLLIGLALAARRGLRLGRPTALRLLGLGGIGYAIQATLFFNAVTSSVRGGERLLAGTPARGSAPQPGLGLGSGVVGPATRGWSCGASHAHACA